MMEADMKGEDRDLGMDRPISRRDFVQGSAVTVGAAAAVASGSIEALAQATQAGPADPRNYPPLRNGMRGAHPGSFEDAPGMNQGKTLPEPVSTHENYDLVVVGGGISGLAAACFFRQRAGASAKILVLDNHDDFGGHAKRNEFYYKGRQLMAAGGSDYLVSPPTWTRESIGLIEDLGVDWAHPKYGARGFQPNRDVKPATFFRKEVYGQDKLVIGSTPAKPTPEFLAQAPLSDKLKADLVELMTGKTDYMPGLSAEEKIARLRKMSYRDYLLNVAKLHPDILAYTGGVWCLGNDMASAWFAYFRYKPGFDGLGLKRPDGSPESPQHEATDFHFPAGNSDLARLMVRALIPDALPAGDWQKVQTTRVNYGALDNPGAAARIRLSSIVFSAKHVGATPVQFQPDGREVEVSYMHGGKAYSVMAKNVVMACMNNIVPYLCPDMPNTQKKALHTAVRAANQQTNVLFRSWEAFAKLGISRVMFPNTFYGSMGLAAPGLAGAMTPIHDPSEPILVSYGTAGNSGLMTNPTMVSELCFGNPPPPGTNGDDQFRAVRMGLLQTPFSTFERHIRTQAARSLAGTNFDPAHDILAITVNRWPHGFATGRNILFDSEDPNELSPTIAAKQKFGRITVCNSDAGGQSLANAAIAEAWRAISELEPRAYGYYEAI
jgi:spermidine dehydrogenase